MRERGADVVHVSSAGNTEVYPRTAFGYQVPLAAQVRAGSGVPTIAVGAILLPQ